MAVLKTYITFPNKCSCNKCFLLVTEAEYLEHIGFIFSTEKLQLLQILQPKPIHYPE
jgi:hypothetical protein